MTLNQNDPPTSRFGVTLTKDKRELKHTSAQIETTIEQNRLACQEDYKSLVTKIPNQGIEQVSERTDQHDVEKGAIKTYTEGQAKDATRKDKLKTGLLMLALCLAVFLAALDITIISTALPTIASHFSSAKGYTWIGSAYMLSSASAAPIWAKVSDIFGRKPILLAANGVFFVGSLMAASANSIGMLITARAIQGIGGGGLTSLVKISIGDIFSMRSRGLYYGFVAIVWAVASGIGPLLGGLFTQRVSWRWCFYVNIPFQAVAFVIICMFFNIHTPQTPFVAGIKAIDSTGALLIVGGLIMLLLGLEFGGVYYPWDSAIVLCLIVFGILTLVLFSFNEWKLAKYPIIPLHIFQGRGVIVCCLISFIHGFVFIGGTFYLPLYFQAVLGYRPIMSGVFTLALVLGLSFTSLGTGISIRKTGNYLPPIWFGLLFMTIGFGLLTDLDESSTHVKIILYEIVAGIGIGPLFQAPLIALQALTPPQDIASAVATFHLFRNVATSSSLVIGAVVLQNSVQSQWDRLASEISEQTADQLSGFNIAANASRIINTLSPREKAVAHNVFAKALTNLWTMYVVMSALGLLCSFMITRKTLAKDHEETKTGLEAEEAKRLDRKENRRKIDTERRAEKECE